MSISSFISAAASLPIVEVSGGGSQIGSGVYGPAPEGAKQARYQGRFSVGEAEHEFRLILQDPNAVPTTGMTEEELATLGWYRDSRGRPYLLYMENGWTGWFYAASGGLGGTVAMRTLEGEDAEPMYYLWLKEGASTAVVYPSRPREG